MKNRISRYDNIIVVIAALVGIFAAIVQFKLGAPQKWHAAITWTVVPFSVVVMAFRRYWMSWRFWVALSLCLGLHVLIMWEIFARLLAEVQWLGTIYVVPFELVEAFVLIFVVAQIMRKFGEPGKYIRIV